MNRPTNRPTAPTPESNWNPVRLFETLTYFDVLPFSDTIRWLQSLWSGDAAARSPMLFSPDAITPRRPIVGLFDPTGTLPLEVATRLESQGIAAIDVTDSTPVDRDLLTAIVVGAATDFPVEALDGAIARLDADLAPQTVFDFSRDDADLRALWGSVDDVVMGGVSQSQAIATSDAMRFAGHVSTANSGGFASIRTRSISPALDLRGVDATATDAAKRLGANTGIELQLTGDGNRYKFILRDRDAWDGIAHCYSFDTQAGSPETPQAVRVPFADCIPTFRAKSVPDSPRLDGSTIAAFQLMLSKFEYDRQLNPAFTPGAFRLDVRSMSAYRTPAIAPIVLAGESSAIAVARTALGERVTTWGTDRAIARFDLSTAIAAIPNDDRADPGELTEAIARHLKLA